MNTNLKKYFPLLKTRKEIEEEIKNKDYLFKEFSEWNQEYQDLFLDFCTGAKGIKMTYDVFFKELMNPEYHRERLEDLISCLLNCKVSIKEILPADSTRIADEVSLLITDIVVELEDGSIVNVEIQKIGFLFPGERCACYSADLLLRQYKRVRNRKKDLFSYRDIKTVYTIVFFEKSEAAFHDFPNEYIHQGSNVFDTGLNLKLPQKYILIPLDIYKKKRHNYGITNKLDAWLAFLTQEDPEEIIELIDKYPEFMEIYQQLYDYCQNIEGVMEMFSKELHELDKNTVKYMIEEQQAEIEEQQAEIEEQQAEIEEKQTEIEEQQAEIEKQKKEIEKLKEQLIVLKR
ncbi:MAG: PD-(D/E)XK nuclease family transposase [Anaerostipes sp.]|jgi:hypothetical protein